MRVKSFIDVILTDNNYDKYRLVRLNTYQDMASGDPMDNICHINGLELEASAGSFEKVQEFRARVSKELGEMKNIIIIDQNRGKIFSDIKNDPFFERLAQNVDYIDGLDDRFYQLKLISEDSSLEKIIKKAFPDPLPSNHQRQCTLL